MDNLNLDFEQLLLIIKKRFFTIILSVILFGGGAYMYTQYFYTPLYTATASMYVFNTSNPTVDTYTSQQLNSAKALVNTYIVILESDTVLQQVVDSLDLQLSPAAVRGMMSAKSINETEAFSVSITSPDPALSQQLANAIADVAPAELIRVVKAGSVEIIDRAKLPTTPSTSSSSKTVLIGVVIGFVLSFGVLLLMAVLDTKIHDEDDLTAAFNIPVLGSIPELNEQLKLLKGKVN